nr:DUF2189 domain-containing protein [Actibacterium sp. 188UL27-1]
MTDYIPPRDASPRPSIRTLTFQDLVTSLFRGWHDARRAWPFGLIFAGFYVAGGLILTFLSPGFLWQIILLALAFPLFAPFAAVGLYEVSRRLERSLRLDGSEILGVLWRERNREIPWLGGLIVFYFLFYSFLAHMIFALFMGLSAMTNVSTSWEAFLTPNGLTMIAVQVLVGAVLGLLLYALTVISLPLVLDKEIDFVSAMILSVGVVRQNPAVMFTWAFILGAVMLLAMIPAFLGLLVALPVLGHASWHLYRRALSHPVA